MLNARTMLGTAVLRGGYSALGVGLSHGQAMKDASRWRVKWYAGLAVFSMLGVARVGDFAA